MCSVPAAQSDGSPGLHTAVKEPPCHMDTARFSSASVLYRSKASAETSGQSKFEHSLKIQRKALLFEKPSLPSQHARAKPGKVGLLHCKQLHPAFSLQSWNTYGKQTHQEKEKETERGDSRHLGQAQQGHRRALLVVMVRDQPHRIQNQALHADITRLLE